MIFIYSLKLFSTFFILFPLSLSKKCKRIRKIYKKAKKQLFFNDFFSFIFEGYFSILFCALLNLVAKKGDKDNTIINSILSYMLLVVILVFLTSSLSYVFA